MLGDLIFRCCVTTCIGKSTSTIANVKHCVIIKGMF